MKHVVPTQLRLLEPPEEADEASTDDPEWFRLDPAIVARNRARLAEVRANLASHAREAAPTRHSTAA